MDSDRFRPSMETSTLVLKWKVPSGPQNCKSSPYILIFDFVPSMRLPHDSLSIAVLSRQDAAMDGKDVS